MRLVFFAPVVALVACSPVGGITRDGGAASTRAVPLIGFDAVTLEGPDDVRVVRGDATSVVAVGPSNVLDELDIRVEGSTLRVGRKRESWKIKWKGTDRVKVTVTMPAIRAAAIAGAGDMVVDRADGPTFVASITGAGSLLVGALRVENAKLDIAGAGDLTAAGSARRIAASIAGAGNIDAPRLTAETSDISVTGSGDVALATTGSANVSIIGAGNVAITGTKNCKVSKIGVGDVSCTG